jgi:Acetyltransferase (GNAT) family
VPTPKRKPKAGKKPDAAARRREAAQRREARKRATTRRQAAKQREKRKRVAKAILTSALPAVTAKDVRLEKGKGTKLRGGGPKGSYWHIFIGEERAGHIYVNIIDQHPFGTHPSIQIFLNKDQRGRHIGRVAYRLACEASGCNEVYAHMRKSNIASRKAAEEAGFSVVEDDSIPQLAMVWRRKSIQ